MGTKRHVLANKKGVPLSIVITSANAHDMKATAETLDCIVTKRPLPTQRKRNNNNRIYVLTKDTTIQR
jgi:putative transposase